MPDFHTFSVSWSKFARLSYFFNLLKIWQISTGKLSTNEEISESYFKMSLPPEPERAAEALRAVVASYFKEKHVHKNLLVGHCRIPISWHHVWRVGLGSFVAEVAQRDEYQVHKN